MNHFSLFQTGTCLLSALLSAADRAVVVVAVKSSSSRSGDSFRVFFFCAPSRTNTHKTSCFLFLSLQPDVSQASKRHTARTERNGTNCSSFFHDILCRFSTVLVHFCRSLPDYSGRTLLRGAFFLRFKFPTHETGLAKNREPFSLLSSSNSSRFRTRKGHRM